MAGCFCFANPSGFLFFPSQKGTICSSVFLDDFIVYGKVANHLQLLEIVYANVKK
jgi:hypothetical protein